MISGLHQHKCPKCGDYTCPQVTHCKRPRDALCPMHAAQAPKSDVQRAIELNKPVEDMMKKIFGIG